MNYVPTANTLEHIIVAINNITYKTMSSESSRSPHAEIRKQSQLRLLQRVCNCVGPNAERLEIRDIVAAATHVVVYEYQIADSQWTKVNMEGSIFIVKGTLSSRPESTAYQLILLNRTSSQNLICPISSSMLVQDESPYMIVREENGPIHGFYFHNAEERALFTTQFQKIMEIVQSIPMASPMATVSSAQPTEASPSPPVVATESVHDLANSLKSVLGIGDSSLPSHASPVGRAVVSDAATPERNSAPSVVSAAAASPAVNNSQGVVMDKHSLQLTLLSLIQNDQFIDILHSQYLKVVRNRVAKQQQQQRSSSS